MTNRPDHRLFPLQPLLDRADVSQGMLSHVLGVAGGAVKRAAIEGLSLSEADRWSHRLGLMAEEIWPELFLADTEGSAA